LNGGRKRDSTNANYTMNIPTYSRAYMPRFPYTDRIIDSLYALGEKNNHSSQVSQEEIEKHMKEQVQEQDIIRLWNDIDFQSELQNAVNRGDIIQTDDSYTLSAAIAEKCRAKQQENERYEAMQQSKKDRRECADILLAYLKQQDQQTKKQQNSNKRQKVEEDSNVPSLSKLGSKLKSLMLNDRMIIVPMIEVRDNETDELKGIDKQFQDAIETVTDGSWTILSVEISRVDTIEGNPRVHAIDEIEGDVKIDALYNCHGCSMDTKLLDKLDIVWSDDDSDFTNGTVSCYSWKADYCEMWQNGYLERVGCYDCDGRCSTVYSSKCPLDEDSDYEGYEYDGGHVPRYENTHNEGFLIGISKELVREQKAERAKSLGLQVHQPEYD